MGLEAHLCYFQISSGRAKLVWNLLSGILVVWLIEEWQTIVMLHYQVNELSMIAKYKQKILIQRSGQIVISEVQTHKDTSR